MSKTILNVDDSASVRQMVQLTLQGAGYRVLQANDGADGLSKARASAVDMVITDLNMPVMDGFELIQQLRGGHYKTTPILVLTTESELQKKEQGKAYGATGWIVKPFNPDNLLQAVKKVCA